MNAHVKTVWVWAAKPEFKKGIRSELPLNQLQKKIWNAYLRAVNKTNISDGINSELKTLEGYLTDGNITPELKALLTIWLERKPKNANLSPKLTAAISTLASLWLTESKVMSRLRHSVQRSTQRYTIQPSMPVSL